MGETDTGGLNIIVYKWKKMKDKGGNMVVGPKY